MLIYNFQKYTKVICISAHDGHWLSEENCDFSFHYANLQSHPLANFQKRRKNIFNVSQDRGGGVNSVNTATRKNRKIAITGTVKLKKNS